MEYLAQATIAFSEEDEYLNGCILGTSRDYYLEEEFKADNLGNLLQFITEYYNVTKENLTLNSCDEIGRLDLTRMETKPFGPKANEESLKLWREGKKKLYYTVYSFRISRIEYVDLEKEIKNV